VALTEAEEARYARQLILPGFAAATQELLRGARVHVVGAGEVAGPALVYLAAAGVGALLVDDPLDVGPDDGAAWLYAADQVGQARTFAAAAALGALNAGARIRPHATGAEPTAALICAASMGTCREAAERARRAGLPHVVALADGGGGEVVAIPVGAPCYGCASRPGRAGPASPGTPAALGALGALELLALLAGATAGPGGRRIELAGGMPQAQPTSRAPSCACGKGRTG
jgi:adenylyltransferase/sulfurtransferase